MSLTIEMLMEMADDAHVSMSMRGRNALTGGPVDRLPPRMWEALRLEMQARYRRATGEEFAVIVIHNDGHLPACGNNVDKRNSGDNP